jgi:hypothetical protein
VLALAINNGGTGESEGSTVYLSMDGGRSFTEAGKSGIFDSVQLVYSNEAVVRIKGSQSEDYTLSRTSDGKTWQPLQMPFTMARPPAKPQFNQASGAPDNLFLSDFQNSGLWYSADGGLSWQKIGASNGIQVLVTPYLPLTLLGLKDNKLYALDLTDAGKSETKGVAATGTPGSRYYPETRHNLSGLFLKYWEEKGGLAQFGYPKTEAFREYNPADGKVYTVQYFERNRFEYHPENAGTQYEILLGLLGNQLTAQRKAAGEGAFNRFDNMHYPGGIYFAETGHNLRNSFKAYWEANGGLAIYGFPISEEFMEVNPDDGQTYVVQYFERNRFEYHPENKGTKYEVLLGLLGNSLLRQKGWL